MRAECLPISSIPHVSRLYQDYLNNFERVSSFYPRPPFSNFYAPEAKSLKYPSERRQRVFLAIDELDARMDLLARHAGSLIGVKYGEPFLQKELLEVDDVVALPVRSI